MEQGAFVIRPINEKDFDWLYEVSHIAGIGFTSLQSDKEYLAKRIDTVQKSFHETLQVEKRIFLFVRENIPSGERIGLCGIHSNVGYKDAFYNYQISTISQASKKLNIFLEHKILSLVNNFQTATELISFWLHPSYRGMNMSRTLSMSRFLFLAQHPEWFGSEVIAEIRGICDENGNSPFWEAIGRHFFAMDFKQADYLTMSVGKQFIADLIAHEPIYLDLLPVAAQNVVAKVHPTSVAARRFLESEGFKYNNHIDIFDGGPLLCIESNQIKAIKNSQLVTVSKCVQNIDNGIEALIYNARSDLRITEGIIELMETGQITIMDSTAKILDIIAGDKVRYCPL